MHDAANVFVKNIETLIVWENDALKGYGAKNYGETLSADILQADIKLFVDGSFVIEAEVWSKVHLIQQKVFELNELISCFKNNNNLKCQRRVSGSCETDLNQLRCDLSEFLQGVERGFDKALRNIDSITNACKSTSRLSRNFYANNQLACGTSCSSSDKDMRRNIKNFITLYNPEQNIVNTKLAEIASGCNGLVDDINTWQAQLS